MNFFTFWIACPHGCPSNCQVCFTNPYEYKKTCYNCGKPIEANPFELMSKAYEYYRKLADELQIPIMVSHQTYRMKTKEGGTRLISTKLGENLGSQIQHALLN
jgi:hypothetical protein